MQGIIIQKLSFAKEKEVKLITLKDLDEAIRWNNEVNQGLSSSLFTSNMSSLFKWTGTK